MKIRTFQLPQKGIHITEQWGLKEGPPKRFIILQDGFSVFAKDPEEVAILLEPIPPELLQWLLESPNDWGPVKPAKLIS